MKRTVLILTLALVVGGCATPPAPHVALPLDEQPMYGGLDRQSIPELKKGDEDFIRKTPHQWLVPLAVWPEVLEQVP